MGWLYCIWSRLSTLWAFGTYCRRLIGYCDTINDWRPILYGSNDWLPQSPVCLHRRFGLGLTTYTCHKNRVYGLQSLRLPYLCRYHERIPCRYSRFLYANLDRLDDSICPWQSTIHSRSSIISASNLHTVMVNNSCIVWSQVLPHTEELATKSRNCPKFLYNQWSLGWSSDSYNYTRHQHRSNLLRWWSLDRQIHSWWLHFRSASS